MMTDLRYLLAIYVHAHRTGSSVPPHIDAEARWHLGLPVSDEPAVPAPPADGEVAELVADLQQQANHGFSDLTRNLLISLASHMAYMQGQLQARHDPDEDDLEDCYWYAESVALRQMVSDALADDPAVPESREPVSVVQEPSDAELVGKLVEAANGAAAMGWDKHAQSILRAAELLQRQVLVPVAVSERLPGDQLCWWFEADEDCGYGSTWTLLRIRGSTTDRTHWLPAHALPLPEVGE